MSEPKRFDSLEEMYLKFPGLEYIVDNNTPVKMLLFEVIADENSKLNLNLVKTTVNNNKDDYLKLLDIMTSLEFKSNKAMIVDIDLLIVFQFEKNLSKAH